MFGFTTSDGIRLHGTDRGGAGFPVVYLHGMGGDAASWEEVDQRLAAAGFRGVGLACRGHGLSHREPCAFDGERLARDVLETADQLGLRRFAVAGHSFGGKIALEVAARAPQRVAALILADPVGPGQVPLDPAAVGAILARADNLEFLRETFRPWYKLWPRPAIDRTLAQMAATPGWAMQAVCDYALWTDRTGPVGRVRASALVIAGTHDPVYGPDYQRRHVLPHLVDGRLVELDCGHGLISEDPAEVAGHCVRFLTTVISP